jgi:regulatory protein
MAEESSKYQKAYEKAQKLLKIRPHHSMEIQRKLTMRGFDRDMASQVISQLTAEGLLDDARFAEIYLDSLTRYKTFGFFGLKAKLMQRGIAGSEAESLLKQNLSLAAEKEIALRVVEKFREPDKMKLAQKLSRKGFRSEVIREVLSSPLLFEEG